MLLSPAERHSHPEGVSVCARIAGRNASLFCLNFGPLLEWFRAGRLPCFIGFHHLFLAKVAYETVNRLTMCVVRTVHPLMLRAYRRRCAVVSRGYDL